jgi:hypothetical protein
MSDTIKSEPISQAMNVLVDAAATIASDIDAGYYFESDFAKHGVPIGTFRVTVQRVNKP